MDACQMNGWKERCFGSSHCQLKLNRKRQVHVSASSPPPVPAPRILVQPEQAGAPDDRHEEPLEALRAVRRFVEGHGGCVQARLPG